MVAILFGRTLRTDVTDHVQLTNLVDAAVREYGRVDEEQKAKLAEAVTKAIMTGANCPEDAVSVCIEDIAPSDWTEQVYKPDIIGNSARLYKKPGYDPE